MMKETDGKTCRYSSSRERGGHILKEYFTYSEREEETKQVMKCFRDRHASWHGGDQRTDKRSNPLIAIPGSSGTGKSAFLAHLPDAEVFRGCLSNPIVVPLTFDCRMTVPADELVLRILYGALQGMVGVPTPFVTMVETVKGCDTLPIVELLWQLFGYRPVVILVDELSKSLKAQEIAVQLGALLDFFPEVYVVISSLTPSFILSLATKMNRPVRYIFPEPMFDEILGAATCKKYAAQFSKQPTLTTILENAHLLASGHPLTLANFDSKFMSFFPNELNDIMSRTQAFPLLSFIAGAVQQCSNLRSPSAKVFEMVLQSNPIWYESLKDEAEEFREASEEHRIFIGRRDKTVNCAFAAVTFATFWKELDAVTEPLTLTRVAQTLFSESRQGEDLITLSSLVERAVDMTLISRSHAEQTVNEVFGVTGISQRKAIPLKLAVRLMDEDAKLREGFWEVPPERAPGMGACGQILTRTSNLVFDVYIQVQCSKPRCVREVPLRMASAINKIVTKHMEDGIESVPFIIFYENCLHERHPTQAQILDELHRIQANPSAIVYAEGCYGCVKVVDQKAMASWMIPTLVPVLRLVHEVELAEETMSIEGRVEASVEPGAKSPSHRE